MALPAFRANDPHACDVHGPLSLASESSPNVKTNRRPQARVGDAFACGGCPNKIRSGASTVTVNGEFAARSTGKSDHPGTLLEGSRNVVIGGPVGVGCVGAAGKVCAAMAAGRNPPPGAVYPPGHALAGRQIPGKTAGQSYNNCGVETCRQMILRATGKSISQEDLLQHAILNGHAFVAKNGRAPWGSGGTTHAGQVGILSDFGVPAEARQGTPEATARAVSEGRGVLAWVWAGTLWGPTPETPAGTGSHAILVTGVEMDEHGNILAFFINDTGAGTCTQRVPAALFSSSLQGVPSIVTSGPIW